MLTFDYVDPTTCNDFRFGTVTQSRSPIGQHYATEHILELQVFSAFITDLSKDLDADLFPDYSTGAPRSQSLCEAIRQLWQDVPVGDQFQMGGISRDPFDHIVASFPGNAANVREFVLLEKDVNSVKAKVSPLDVPTSQ